MQWRAFVDAQRVELARFARETAPLGCACALGLVVARGSNLYNVAALVHAGQVWGFVPKEKLPLYNVFYEARTLARGVGGPLRHPRRACPSATSSSTSTSARVALEVCEDGWSPDGPMRRRSYAGAEIVVQPQRLSVSPRRRRDAPRDDRDARRRLPGDGRVRQRWSAPTTGSCSTAAASWRRTAALLLSSAALSRRGRGRDARSRPHPAPAHREHDVARGPGGLRGALAPKVTRVRVDAPTPRPRDALVFPAPVAQELLPARSRRRPRSAARRVLRGAARRARARASATTSRRPASFKTIGVALSGGRDSLLVLAIARRWIDRRWAALARRRAPGEGARAAPRASTCRRGSRRPRRAPPPSRSARDLDAPLAVVSIDDAFERELVGGREDAPAGRDADGAGAPERAGARARRAHVDVGERGAGALPADEQHEREGRRLRHHRRRRGGRAQRDRERPEDRRQLPPRLAVRDDALGGHPPHAAQAGDRRARGGPGGRARAHAVPGARRVLRALRGREDVARRGGRGAQGGLPRARARAPRRLGRALRRGSSRRRSTSGSRRPSRSTSATWTSSASARCSSRSCSAASGTRHEKSRQDVKSESRPRRPAGRPAQTPLTPCSGFLEHRVLSDSSAPLLHAVRRPGRDPLGGSRLGGARAPASSPGAGARGGRAGGCTARRRRRPRRPVACAPSRPITTIPRSASPAVAVDRLAGGRGCSSNRASQSSHATARARARSRGRDAVVDELASPGVRGREERVHRQREPREALDAARCLDRQVKPDAPPQREGARPARPEAHAEEKLGGDRQRGERAGRPRLGEPFDYDPAGRRAVDGLRAVERRAAP